MSSEGEGVPASESLLAGVENRRAIDAARTASVAVAAFRKHWWLPAGEPIECRCRHTGSVHDFVVRGRVLREDRRLVGQVRVRPVDGPWRPVMHRPEELARWLDVPDEQLQAEGVAARRIHWRANRWWWIFLVVQLLLAVVLLALGGVQAALIELAAALFALLFVTSVVTELVTWRSASVPIPRVREPWLSGERS